MFDKINLFYFVISFCIGLIMVNLIKPKPEVIFKFPTKYNVNDTTYENSSGSCYKYNYEEINCPTDGKNVKDHPVESFIGVKI